MKRTPTAIAFPLYGDFIVPLLRSRSPKHFHDVCGSFDSLYVFEPASARKTMSPAMAIPASGESGLHSANVAATTPTTPRNTLIQPIPLPNLGFLIIAAPRQIIPIVARTSPAISRASKIA